MQPLVLSPGEPGCKYSWNAVRHPVLLPAPVQERRSCAFVSVALQVNYSLSIMNGKKGIEYTPSFNAVEWESDVRHKYGQEGNFEPYLLMYEILREERKRREYGFERARGVGLLVANSGTKHWCDFVSKKEAPKPKYIHDWIIKWQTPLVTILPNLPGEYHVRSETPYLNEKPRYTREQLLGCMRDPNFKTHAVVLVGAYYPSKDGNPLGLVVENRDYFIFQSPNFPEVVRGFNDGSIRSLLPGGMSIVCSSLIMQVSLTLNFPQPSIIHRCPEHILNNDVEKTMLRKVIAYYENVISKSREESDYVAEFERMFPNPNLHN